MVRLTRLIAASAIGPILSLSQSTGFKSCNALIEAGLGSSLLLPSGPDSNYTLALESYWSLTIQEVLPWCILQPKDTQEVAAAVKALSALSGAGSWNIAVKGGGHSHWNNNNIAQGVTIDLARLAGTEIRPASCGNGSYTHVAAIGAGSNWGDALRAAEAQGLGITGGRVSTVGVAGLTLGGGASFHSGRRGFACDDVLNYEVVLADGSVVNANKHENPRLWKALKGGGSNFGIVTRFDMAAFPAGDIYGGIALSTWDQKDIYIDHFLGMMRRTASAPADSQLLLMQHTAGMPVPLIGTIRVNVDGHSNGTMFTEFRSVPTVFNTFQKWPYSDMIATQTTANGSRTVWFSLCFHAVREMIQKAESLLLELIGDLNALGYADEEMSSMFSFQPLPRSWVRDGNVLGLDESLNEDAILFLAQTFVQTREMEAFFQRRFAAVTAELEGYAKEIGADTPFRYMNYVHPTQDPLASYGEKNVAFIRDVAKEYDPTGFFQNRVSGGFKISAVGENSS